MKELEASNVHRWNEDVMGFPTMHVQGSNLFMAKNDDHRRDFGDFANSSPLRKRKVHVECGCV